MEEEKEDIVNGLVLSNGFEGIERWGKDIHYTDSFFQCILYIVKVNEGFINYLKVVVHFFVYVVLWVECHRVGQEVFCRRSGSLENTCSGSHEALEI